ncbi:MAG: excinuclease ABC subunit UvrA [Flavobacteriales bacterium]|nr:excinuclease ABC subunit UvrA [Flavobacteriales bacterium]
MQVETKKATTSTISEPKAKKKGNVGLQFIDVQGARENNLKDIDISIPRNKLVVITGLSGSGKSSLAFDTLYAEGQRRYIESFSTYIRQFLGGSERPDVDKISGLSPVISVEQKTTSRNPRSTVGTTTEIYDFLRLLYAKIATAISYNSGEEMVRFTTDQIIDLLLKKFENEDIVILAPVVSGRKGHYSELFNQILRKGFLKVRVDGEIIEISSKLKVDRYKIHDIEIVIDQIKIGKKVRKRIVDSVELAMGHSNGTIMVVREGDRVTVPPTYLSKSLMCPSTGISYAEPEPNTFSFNSPYGACAVCKGTGTISEIDTKKIAPNTRLSINEGAIEPIGKAKSNWIFKQLIAIGDNYGFDLDTPLKDFSKEALNTIYYGSDDMLKIKNISVEGNKEKHISTDYALSFEGIVNFLLKQFVEAPTPAIKRWASGFMNKITCHECNGNRLKKESLHFFIDGKNIADVANMEITQLVEWTAGLEKKFSKREMIIANEIIKELEARAQFLLDVGVDYLSLNRSSKELSGGESQRIRLATQIGSKLVGVLYILDEPSIGLHQRDNTRLIEALVKLRDAGNSVIVVEHDKQMIESADHVIDMGPGAGILGGNIVAEGPPESIKDTLTSDYLNGKKKIEIPKKRLDGTGETLVLKGATGNNLDSVDLVLPLGKLICVTGVSGSGKSTLVNKTLYPILNAYLYKGVKKPLAYDRIEGLENIDKVIEIDQSPIGRTPRSNPATYTGAFTDIRKLFVDVPEAKIRGYKPGRFSFNVTGGRCETCKGAGLRTIEMNFLPDVYVNCEACNGKRYNRETLEVRYKGKSISDVLNMTINQGVEFFKNIPGIIQKIRTLAAVGLGYVTLGQASTTLSGGEAQRVKLATELSKKMTGKSLYILDEPTTGLHFEDVRVLLIVLNKLVEKGNTVVVIEHNMDIIKVADHIIDLGPGGGKLGGKIIASGTPEEVVKNKESITAQYLKRELDLN